MRLELGDAEHTRGDLARLLRSDLVGAAALGADGLCIVNRLVEALERRRLRDGDVPVVESLERADRIARGNG